jgi:hypothetical protein
MAACVDSSTRALKRELPGGDAVATGANVTIDAVASPVIYNPDATGDDVESTTNLTADAIFNGEADGLAAGGTSSITIPTPYTPNTGSARRAFLK